MNVRLTSSLEKVFPDVPFEGVELNGGCAWQNEVYAFQLAACPEESGFLEVKLEVPAPLSGEWFEVMPVPVELPFHVGDENYLRGTPGLYPDLLQPRPEKQVRWIARQWRSIWVSVRVPADCPAGVYPIRVGLKETEKVFSLEVKAERPAAFGLRHLEWFHADCLASYYRVPVWSEDFWRIVRNFVDSAVAHHINSLYTPLWTPPLDTAVGAERPTVQLLQIERSADGEYHFDFSRLERWSAMAHQAGCAYLELSHFFTQWGARATPKIMATVDGAERRIFGWDVAADDPEYARFLRALLPPLRKKLEELGWKNRIYCHVSDEPAEEQLEAYRQACDILKPLIGDWIQADALSHYEFYRHGLVELPIPSIGVMGDFAGKVPELWGYYCCGPEVKTVNRFMAMPSARVRMLGVIAYVYDWKGFLHWGYNFYYSQLSIEQPIDPFRVTDGGRAFPAGDAYLVYPAPDGTAWSSLRHETLREGWQDWCALKRHEEIHGRKATLALLNQGLKQPIDAEHYPIDAAWLLDLRGRLSDR